MALTKVFSHSKIWPKVGKDGQFDPELFCAPSMVMFLRTRGLTLFFYTFINDLLDDVISHTAANDDGSTLYS